ncbi:aconitate hydratase [Modestobacter sp. I12A-02662]|uniref:aconitate hydratase n=1 Tax=Modestobacter sp. I12A-02662 TaxID=1730496 RepID=UPI0034E04610
MPDNVTRKLLRDHLVAGELEPGATLTLAVDQVLIEDATGTMTAMQFEMLGVEELGVPLAVQYVDHNVLQIDDKNLQDHKYLESFCRRYGLRYSPAGNGISHYLHLEHFARPGELLVGADSHTTSSGAVGMFAVGAGGLDVAVAMAGYGYDLACPRVVGVELTGRLPAWVEAKDVILELLRRTTVRGGLGTVFEFFGEGVAGLPVTDRATIANMIVETGATTAVFPSDEQTRAWLRSQAREEDFRPLVADPGAGFDDVVRIDLADLEPLVARPHSPDNVVPVREVAGTRIVQVCVGSSVNSSYQNLATVAEVLRGRTVHPDLQVTVNPGSRQILDTITRSGVYGHLLNAGARVLEPICGPCVGIGYAPTKGEPSLRTFNRNFPGRSGTAGDSVWLCSPSTAAASALHGVITDPRTLGEPPELPPADNDPLVDARFITAVLPPGERRRVQIWRGPNQQPPPDIGPLPDDVEGRVVIVLGDDISTGDMAPDGAIAMSIWSDITACARFMFQRNDPDFHSRVTSWGGGIIVAGHNYGQGSSREHAALNPRFLGVRAIVAAGFARIHRSNLIAQGIVPLVAEDAAGSASVGDTWRIPGLRAAVGSGADEVSVDVEGQGGLAVRLQLAPAERELLLAGGLLAHTRAGRRPLVPDARRTPAPFAPGS